MTPTIPEDAVEAARGRKFALGDRVTKIKGSSWTGRVVGFYGTRLTPIGYAVESENEPGSVQIYPEAALSALPHAQGATSDERAEAAARILAKWFGYAWEGLDDGRVTDKGFPVFTCGQFGWGFQGHKGDMVDLAREVLSAAASAGNAHPAVAHENHRLDPNSLSRIGALAPEAAHPDDLAVDRFAAAMKAKLAKKRAEGRGGWDDPAECRIEDLSYMLVQHLHKGDPVDIGNFAMMIHQRGARVILDDETKAIMPSYPSDPEDKGGEENAPDMLARLRDDAALWAAEFRKTAINLGYADMDEGWLIGWFANAIENTEVVRREKWSRPTHPAPSEGLEVVAWRYRHVNYVGWGFSDQRHPSERLEQEPLVRADEANARIAELEVEVERQRRAGYCDAIFLSDGPPFKCGWQHCAEASEDSIAKLERKWRFQMDRADALENALRELVQRPTDLVARDAARAALSQLEDE